MPRFGIYGPSRSYTIQPGAEYIQVVVNCAYDESTMYSSHAFDARLYANERQAAVELHYLCANLCKFGAYMHICRHEAMLFTVPLAAMMLF